MCPVCVLLCVACVSVWSWSVLQFALQDLKIALANTPSVHPLFVLYCIVYYKSVCAHACVCSDPFNPFTGCLMVGIDVFHSYALRPVGDPQGLG